MSTATDSTKGTSNLNAVMEAVKHAAIPLTRVEIQQRTGLTKEQVRKATNALTQDKRLTMHQSNLGVPFYQPGARANYDGMKSKMESLNEIHEQRRQAKHIIDAGWREAAPSGSDAWGHLVKEAEQRGFALGYSKGVQESQRTAYEQGKKSVLTKLEVLLS